MAQCVAGDQRDGLLSQLFEIERQIRQSSGYPFDPVTLKCHLQSAIEGKFVTPVFANDKTKDGWTLLEHTPRRITSMRNLELVPFLEKGEGCVGGKEMVRRARKELNANYGQEDAEFCLEHQDEIPKEFRKYITVFTGTIWRVQDDDRLVSCLYWDGGRWFLSFDWLERGFSDDCRLLRPRE